MQRQGGRVPGMLVLGGRASRFDLGRNHFQRRGPHRVGRAGAERAGVEQLSEGNAGGGGGRRASDQMTAQPHRIGPLEDLQSAGHKRAP